MNHACIDVEVSNLNAGCFGNLFRVVSALSFRLRLLRLLLLLLNRGRRSIRQWCKIGIAVGLIGKPQIGQGQVLKLCPRPRVGFRFCPGIHVRCFDPVDIPRSHR